MASRYLSAQIETLESYGFPKAKSLSALAIKEKELTNKYNRFDILKLISLYDAASAALNDPHIALRVGFQFRVSTFEQTGNIYTVCDNIRQVVEMNSRYQHIAINAGDVNLIDEKGYSFLHFEPLYNDIEQGPSITNVVFGAYGTAFRWLNWGSGKGLKTVYLRQTEPEDKSLFQHVFDCPVHFEAPHNRLEFFPEHLDLPFPTRDPIKLAKFKAQLDHMMNSENSNQSFLDAVEISIRHQMENGQVNFQNLTRDLTLSDAKTRKAFARAKTNFRSELDNARQVYFRELITSGDSYATIAQKLSYGDQAAFSRAFKRWYGCAPGEWSQDMPLLKK